jgi:Flp pilus assembly pilin Flp
MNEMLCMTEMLRRFRRLRVWQSRRGQDLVEYALLAGFVAVAAGVFIPDVSSSLVLIYSRLASRLVQANG